MRARLALLLGAVPVAAGAAEAALQLAPEVVTAARLPQPGAESPATVRRLSGDDVAAAPALTLDGALRSLPAFSLFRRTDSLAANPTAQGVSLRGLGPSGASRTLLLLDGVPLNDPFGGWVAWAKLPREGLAAVEVVPGGGGAAWGNAALGGVLQLLSREREGPGGTLATLAGDRGTRSAEAEVTAPAGEGWIDVAGRWFASDGFPLVAPERRGPVDTAAGSRHRWGQARWRQTFAGGTSLAVALRSFAETRGNGTPYTGNTSRETSGQVTARGGSPGGPTWTLAAYAQRQVFTSTFSSVNATRTAETPASDQYAVPAQAAGLAGTLGWRHAGGARTAAGGDLRAVRGETRELFTYTGGRFTRRRIAGGRQEVAGAWLHHDQPLGAGWRVSGGSRLDFWRETAGHRREEERDTGAALRDERFTGRRGTAFSPGAGVTWTPAAGWRFRANAQGAFRRPTLNELYRPFRQGANVTEANPSLATERARGGEVAVEWRQAAGLSVEVVRFRQDLHDAVANVTVARGPGVFPVVGSLPAGGLGRQRLNLDRLRVAGWEAAARWTPGPGWNLTAAVLLNRATVAQAGVAPALAGRDVAQVPRRTLVLGVEGPVGAGWTLAARMRASGRQFEDDENQLPLAAVTVADLTLRRALGGGRTLFLTAENLGGARVEAGRGADGVVTLATPRLFLAGLRAAW
jgi:outer membrane receptor protein involved in Fe transport